MSMDDSIKKILIMLYLLMILFISKLVIETWFL
jgi:hypothetical protein